MTSRPRVLSISFSDLRHDARVLRQLAILREFADVTTIGYGSPPDGVGEHLEIPEALPSLPQTGLGVLLLATRQYRTVRLRAPAIVAARRLLADRRFDAVVANEARALPLAHAVATGAPVWGDMHEWAPGERTHVLAWRLLVAPYMRWVCSTYLPKTTIVSAVNASIAELYDQEFGLSTYVVRNARAYLDLKPSAMEPGRIRLAHSGTAVPGRNIETLILATLSLDDRFTLDLYLMRARDHGRYWQKLYDLAAGSPRIVFHDAVPPDELPVHLNESDIGVFVLPPRTTNHRLMLPNKFFDFVQARLVLVFSPAVETDLLIREHDLGRITAGFSINDLVKTLSTLTPDLVTRYKANTNAAAMALSSQQDEDVQRSIIRDLLALPRR